MAAPDVSQVGPISKPLFQGINPYKAAVVVSEPNKSSLSPASSVSSAEQILKQIKYHRQQQERELHEFAQSLVDEEPKSYLQHTQHQQQLHHNQQQSQAQVKNDKNSSSSRRRLGRHESRYTSGNYNLILCYHSSIHASLFVIPFTISKIA